MKKKNNYFFEIYEIISEESDQCLAMKHMRLDTDFNDIISGQNIRNIENTFTCKFKNDGNVFKYGYNIKQDLINKYPDIINSLCESFGSDIIANDNIGIRLISSYDYRQYDKKYDNECKFIEYIMSEKSKEDKETQITEEILIDAGFEYLEKESSLTQDYQNELYGKNNYKVFRKWTNDSSPLKLDIDNRVNNRGTEWYLHIDNDHCESIGSADIDNIWEFNTLMEVFGSKFRL